MVLMAREPRDPVLRRALHEWEDEEHQGLDDYDCSCMWCTGREPGYFRMLEVPPYAIVPFWLRKERYEEWKRLRILLDLANDTCPIYSVPRELCTLLTSITVVARLDFSLDFSLDPTCRHETWY